MNSKVAKLIRSTHLFLGTRQGKKRTYTIENGESVGNAVYSSMTMSYKRCRAITPAVFSTSAALCRSLNKPRAAWRPF